MYTHHSLLLTPGPTPIPQRIQAAMNLPMVGIVHLTLNTLLRLHFVH